MHFKVYVTKYDIANGTRSSCMFCPIALAVTRAYKKVFPKGTGFFTVTGGYIRFYASYKDYKEQNATGLFLTPLRLRTFISEFDERQNPRAFNFEMDINVTPKNYHDSVTNY